MSDAPQFGVKIGSILAQCEQYLKPDDTRKSKPRAYKVNKTSFPSHKVPRIMRAKAKKAPMCSVSLIAIELKRLAAPGEALKIFVHAAHALFASNFNQILYESISF